MKQAFVIITLAVLIVGGISSYMTHSWNLAISYFGVWCGTLYGYYWGSEDEKQNTSVLLLSMSVLAKAIHNLWGDEGTKKAETECMKIFKLK